MFRLSEGGAREGIYRELIECMGTGTEREMKDRKTCSKGKEVKFS